MSRHRNVRSMNYTEEYEGYDDVYGHSVEDDYAMSPSDAAFMYDRNKPHQMSAFVCEDSDIAEENEDEVEEQPQDEMTEARIRSCIEEIQNVVGDSIPNEEIRKAVVSKKYDFNRALEALLSEAPFEKQAYVVGAREPKVEDTRRVVPTILLDPVPAKPKVIHVTKGFDVSANVKSDSIRCSSPSSGRASPSVDDSEKKRPTETPNSKTRTRGPQDIENQYKTERGQQKEKLHLLVIGHVDAGKSTLMGHLLYDIGQVNKRTMHKYEQESKKLGKQSFMYAWVLDETGEERSRGITMDVGQSCFETRTKSVTLLDAPGHKDFIPNMISGATQADVALLVVDATRGEFETGFESGGQTREHALLVRSLGVSQLGVVINKLDTVGWSQSRFDEIVGKLNFFLKQAGFRESDINYVPCSGLAGENLAKSATVPELVSWYKGPCLLDVIDNFKTPERPITKPLRMSISDIYKGVGSGMCVSGRVETGVVAVGDKVIVMPLNEAAQVRGLTIDELPVQTAYAGDSVAVTLANIDVQNIAVGFVICDMTFPCIVCTRFEARVVIFNITVPITAGYPCVIHAHSFAEPATIVKLVSQLNKSTGEVVKKKPRCLTKNSNAVIEIETSRPVSLELYKEIKELGRFMVRVNGVSIAAGLVTKII